MSAVSIVEHLAIVQACTDLLHRFALKNDARDADALAEMFVEDGVFRRPTMPDQPYVGREAIRAGFRAKPASVLTHHIISNIVVTVVGPAEARVESYIQLYTAKVAEGAKLPVPADAKALLGAFADVVVRDADGEWRFKDRRGSLAIAIGG